MRRFKSFLKTMIIFCLIYDFAIAEPFVEATLESGSGWYVGNGGAQVVCRKYDEQWNLINENFYTLDYVLGSKKKQIDELRYSNVLVEEENTAFDFIRNLKKLPYSRLNPVELSMINFLSQKSSFLANDYKNFLESSLNTSTDNSTTWVSEYLPLITNNSPSFIDGCELKQAILREKKGNQLFFKYDFDLPLNLFTSRLQKSFMLTHEWLWKFTDVGENIIELNWFLHSKEAISLSSHQFLEKMQRLGFRQNFVESDSIIKPVPRILKELEMKCEDDIMFTFTDCKIFDDSRATREKRPVVNKVTLIKSNGNCTENVNWGIKGLEPLALQHTKATIWTKDSCKATFKIEYSILQ